MALHSNHPGSEPNEPGAIYIQLSDEDLIRLGVQVGHLKLESNEAKYQIPPHPGRPTFSDPKNVQKPFHSRFD